MITSVLLVIVLYLTQSTCSTVYPCDHNQPCGCSRSFPIVAQLVGGEFAVDYSWGWAVSLQMYDRHFCGGTILNKDFIITAAHCTIDKMKAISSITICAGTNRLDETCPQRRSVKSIINHPNYRSSPPENDIALVRVTPPFNISDKFIKPLCIPGAMDDANYPRPAQKLIAIGWGSMTGSKNNVSVALQQVTINVKNKNESTCKKMLANDRVQFCASAPDKGTCFGDSGGPIMLYDWRVQRWFLIGLTSYGSATSCTDRDNSNVMTRVSAYRSFINQHVNIYSCSCHCPQDRNSSTAFTTINSHVECVDACMSVPSNPCVEHNTYACIGQSCAYHSLYNQSRASLTTSTPKQRAIAKYGVPHGGHGGGPFDDAVDLKLSPHTECIGVQLFWKPDYLFAIRFIYQYDDSSTPTVYHGDPSDYKSSLLEETFMMNGRERINKVTWYVGTNIWYVNDQRVRYVLGIKFHTTAGRTSQLYGSNKGEVYTESYEGHTLGYVKGRSGLFVDMLHFVWYNQDMDCKICNDSTYNYSCSQCQKSTNGCVHSCRCHMVNGSLINTSIILTPGSANICTLENANGQLACRASCASNMSIATSTSTTTTEDTTSTSYIIKSFEKAFPNDTILVYKYKRGGAGYFYGTKLLELVLKDEYWLKIFKLSKSTNGSMIQDQIKSIVSPVINETKDEIDSSKRRDILHTKLEALFPGYLVNIFIFNDNDWTRHSRNTKGSVYFEKDYGSEIDIVLS